jgi:ribokinase
MYGSRVVPAVRLTALGSLNMDISVTVPRLPVPGATVLGGAAAYAPGGKGANQAVAAARLGTSVRMVGCVGDDDFGTRLRAALRAEGVEDAGVRAVPGVPTGLAMITVDGTGENMITVAPGANREAGEDEIAAVRASRADVLVISAEIPVPVIKAALAAAGPALRVLNLAPAPPEAADLIAAGVDWLVVNEPEAASVLGTPVDGLAGAARAAASLAEAGPRNVVVTAGAEGAAYRGAADPGESNAPGVDNSKSNAPGEVTTIPGFRVHAVDSVGAGDTFVGALAAALGAGIAPEEAIRAAAAAGAAAATRPGTQSGMPRPADILAVTGLTWPITRPHRTR